LSDSLRGFPHEPADQEQQCKLANEDRDGVFPRRGLRRKARGGDQEEREKKQSSAATRPWPRRRRIRTPKVVAGSLHRLDMGLEQGVNALRLAGKINAPFGPEVGLSACRQQHRI
jgi:hypothetical protein